MKDNNTLLYVAVGIGAFFLITELSKKSNSNQSQTGGYPTPPPLQPQQQQQWWQELLTEVPDLAESIINIFDGGRAANIQDAYAIATGQINNNTVGNIYQMPRLKK